MKKCSSGCSLFLGSLETKIVEVVFENDERRLHAVSRSYANPSRAVQFFIATESQFAKLLLSFHVFVSIYFSSQGFRFF